MISDRNDTSTLGRCLKGSYDLALEHLLVAETLFHKRVRSNGGSYNTILSSSKSDEVMVASQSGGVDPSDEKTAQTSGGIQPTGTKLPDSAEKGGGQEPQCSSSPCDEESLFEFMSVHDERDDDDSSLLKEPAALTPQVAGSCSHSTAIRSESGIKSEQRADDKEFLLSCGTHNGKEVFLRHHYKLIGRGSTCKVYSGQLFMSTFDPAQPPSGDNFNIAVAVKSMEVETRRDDIFCVLRDTFLIRCTISHPNIVATYFLSELVDHEALLLQNEKPFSVQCVLALEYSTIGSAADLVKRREKMRAHEVRHILADIIPAVEYLHSVGVVHNDIKPQNILTFPRNVNPFSTYLASSSSASTTSSCLLDSSLLNYQFKLTDFSACTYAALPEALRKTLSQPPKEVLKNSAERGYFLGTATFMSPESCISVDNSTTNDIWSIGVTAFYLATGRVPWSQLEAGYPDIILNGFREKYASGHLFGGAAHNRSNEGDAVSGDTEDSSSGAGAFCYASFGPMLDELDDLSYSPELCSLIRWCMTENPLERPTCAQILAHPFMTQKDES